MATAPIGEALSRVDAPLKVTGGATYVADNNPTNLAYGYLILSTIGLGAVTAMDTAAALAAPGVLDVYTPFHPLQLFAYGGDENDESFPPLQTTDVRYYGQVIGMVVADTFERARDAATLVTTTYAPKTPLTSLTSGPVTPVAAPVTVTQTYTTAIVHHHAMEPHATVASWAAGHLTINTVTQSAPLVVRRLSHTLGTDASKIHVLNPYVGGAFGGKWGNWAHTPLTAAAARVLDRPVKTVLTREQVFTVVGHRPETTQTVSIGASTDGVLTAIQQKATASKSNSSNFSENPAGVANTSYAAGTISTSNTHVPLDLPATTIMRAPGEANGAFALESAMDELAVALALDPLALRQKNYANTVPNNGQPWSSKHLAECYDIGAQRFGWSKRNPTPGAVTDGDWLVGLGMATATYPAFLNQAAQKVRFTADGTVVVSSTGSDSGTGQFTVLTMIASAGLGVPVTRVRTELGDSSAVIAADAGGSSSTASNGTAVGLAASAAITALIDVAVSNPSSPFNGKTVTYANGILSAGNTRMSFGALLTRLNLAGVAAAATSPGKTTPGFGYMSFGAHFCEVRVNRWTAEPKVTRLLCVVDAGTIVNSKTARSQIMGGMIMGLGQALMEGTVVEPTGRFANTNLASYLVPVNADIPEIDVEFVIHPDTLFDPLGMRGIGELGIVGIAPAVANAIYNATGKRIRDLPITLDKLL